MAQARTSSHIDGGFDRGWPYFLTIFVGVSLLGIAIWPGAPSASLDADLQTRNTQTLWLVHALTGAAALAAVFVAQRSQRRPIGRMILALAGIILLTTLLIFRDFGVRPLLVLLLPGVLLLVCAVLIGPVPDERRTPR